MLDKNPSLWYNAPMEKVKKMAKEFTDALEKAEYFLDNLDENGDLDVLIEETLNHRKALSKPWRWKAYVYLHERYFNPINESLFKGFVEKWPMFKKDFYYECKEGKKPVMWSMGNEKTVFHLIEDYTKNKEDFDPWWSYPFIDWDEAKAEECKKDAKEVLKKWKEAKPQLEEAGRIVKEWDEYYRDSVWSHEDIFKRIVNTLAYLKAKKNLSK